MKISRCVVTLSAVLLPSFGLVLSQNSLASDGMMYPDHLKTNYGLIVTDNFGQCVGLGAGEMTTENQCGPKMVAEKEEPKPVEHAPMAAPKPDITLSADALFDFDKSVLKPQGKTAIDRELAKINHNSGKSIQAIKIVGYTDSVGTEKYNLKLSLRRAEAVKAYLVKKGIKGGIIQVEGLGESHPVASNANAAGRAKNRRAEIFITYQ